MQVRTRRNAVRAEFDLWMALPQKAVCIAAKQIPAATVFCRNTPR